MLWLLGNNKINDSENDKKKQELSGHDMNNPSFARRY
jgi:hypothetical protein